MRIRFILAIVCVVCYTQSFSQKHNISYRGELGGGVSGNRLPFWLHSNTYGKITEDTYLWGTVGLATPFSKSNTRAFDYSFGAEGTGALGKDDNRLFLNQVYGRVRWQNLVFNLGILNPETIYDGLSSTNGNILYSTNARSIPGISLSTWDFIKLPWIFGRWISFKGQYGEYLMIDNRYAGDRTRLHHKSLAIRLTIVPQLSIEAGMEHFAQWGGETPQDGKLPASFKDYLRVVTIRAGGDDSPANEINKLGNHIGEHFAKIKYNHSKWGAELYYNHMFEDGSGQKFKNWPDGLYGLYFTRKTSPKWFKSFVYEFYYTKCQSGPNHNDPATGLIVGGNDNYFNNSIYRSGWTFFGNVIGSPFFTPKNKEENGMTHGVINSRFYAHHLGICGTLPGEIQYKLLMSYSHNYGMHNPPFMDENNARIAKPQFSFGLELVAPDLKLPFDTALNIGFDKGDLLKNNFGVMLKIFKSGIF